MPCAAKVRDARARQWESIAFGYRVSPAHAPADQAADRAWDRAPHGLILSPNQVSHQLRFGAQGHVWLGGARVTERIPDEPYFSRLASPPRREVRPEDHVVGRGEGGTEPAGPGLCHVALECTKVFTRKAKVTVHHHLLCVGGVGGAGLYNLK